MTCKKEEGTSGASPNSNIDVVGEEVMREAYHEAVMEMQMPEDAPPLTQPSQPEAAPPLTQPSEPDQVVEAYVTFDNDDTPLAVTVKKIKKSKMVNKATVAEEVRRATIKKEHVDGAEMHNAYSGAMKLGPPPPPPVKQYKTIVGGTTLKYAPFQPHGKTVITKGALQAAAKLQPGGS